MVRAVEGMVKELDATFIAFFVSIFFFQTATAATSFVVMEDDAAWIALAIYIVGSYVWYKYCIRIYNRFKLRSVGFAWKDDEDERPEGRDRDSQDSMQSSYSHVQKNSGLVAQDAPKHKKPSLLGKLGRMTARGDLK
jgi:hypothetical protein